MSHVNAKMIIALTAATGLSFAVLAGCSAGPDGSDSTNVPPQGASTNRAANGDANAANGDADANSSNAESDANGNAAEHRDGRGNENGNKGKNANENESENENERRDAGNDSKDSKDSQEHDRFTVERESWGGTDLSVITDTETGVQYLMTDGYRGQSLTPLLGTDGKPLIDKSAVNAGDQVPGDPNKEVVG